MRAVIFYAAAMALAMIPLVGAGAGQPSLAALKWKARPIVILSDDPRVAKQVSALDRARPELSDRAIRVLREARPKSDLRKRLGVAERGFAVVLVGKDGSVKRVWRDPVAPRDIFTVIDAMPMRQREMRG